MATADCTVVLLLFFKLGKIWSSWVKIFVNMNTIYYMCGYDQATTTTKSSFDCDFCMCFIGGNWHISGQNHVCVFSNAASSEIFEPQQDGNLHWTLHQFRENDPFSRSLQCLNKIRKVIYVPVLNRRKHLYGSEATVFTPTSFFVVETICSHNRTLCIKALLHLVSSTCMVHHCCILPLVRLVRD